MTDFNKILLGIVVALFIFVGIRFRKTRLFSNFPYQSDEKTLFDEKPNKLEFGSKQATTSIGMGAGGGIEVISRRSRRTRIVRPWVRVTNKNIIIVQKKEQDSDGPINLVLALEPVTEPGFLTWWKRGYTRIPVVVSNIRAVSNPDGTYMIEIPMPALIPLPGTENLIQTADIWTAQLSEYEKALNIKIPIRSES